MTAAITEGLVTAEEFEKIAHRYDRCELIDGRIVKLAPVGKRHGKVELRVGSILLAYVEDNDLGEVEVGEVGCKLPNGRVRAPDVLFVRKERLSEWELQNDGYWSFAPDLAVEVVSPSDTKARVTDKANEWIAGGTTLVWIVDPAVCTVTVVERGKAPIVLREDATLEGGALLPGFSCRVGQFFS